MKVLKLGLGVWFAFIFSVAIAGTAGAQTCTAYPNTLTNGTTADATQVMANFNCAVLLGAAHFTGNVGIGTASPSALLHVSQTDTSVAALFNGTTKGLRVGFNSSNAILEGVDSTGVGSYQPLFVDGSQLEFAISGSEKVRINSSGNVGIGTTTPGSYQLYVNGSAYATGTWSTSDGRLKDHVATVTGGLALVEQLHPVRYDWMPAEKRTVGRDLRLATDRPQIGFIAQEVEKVVPEAVTPPTKGGSDTYSMNEATLIPILTKAIQEQQAEIAELRSDVAALKSKLAANPPH